LRRECSCSTRVQVGFVLDGDDSLDPIGIPEPATQLDSASIAATSFDDAALGGAMDGLPDVPPGISRVRERIAVPLPVSRRVSDDV
jgi:hypothetical protein